MSDSSLATRDALLTALVKHPAWPEFCKALDELIDEQTIRFARDAMLQIHGGISEGDLQYRRGVLYGIRAAVKVANGAKVRFDRQSEEDKS